MFIIELTYIKPLAEIDAHIDAHKSFLHKHYASGKLIISGRKNPRTGGIIVAGVDTLDEVNQIISEDPFNINGLATYAVTEFFPTMASDNLQFLLEESNN